MVLNSSSKSLKRKNAGTNPAWSATKIKLCPKKTLVQASREYYSIKDHFLSQMSALPFYTAEWLGLENFSFTRVLQYPKGGSHWR